MLDHVGGNDSVEQSDDAHFPERPLHLDIVRTRGQRHRNPVCLQLADELQRAGYRGKGDILVVELIRFLGDALPGFFRPVGKVFGQNMREGRPLDDPGKVGDAGLVPLAHLVPKHIVIPFRVS